MEIVSGLAVVPGSCNEVASQLKTAARKAASSQDISKKHLATVVMKGVQGCKDLAMQLSLKQEELLLKCLNSLLWMLSGEQQDDNTQLMTLGQGLTSCGLLHLLLLTPDTIVDPVEKEKCKLDWAKDEVCPFCLFAGMEFV